MEGLPYTLQDLLACHLPLRLRRQVAIPGNETALAAAQGDYRFFARDKTLRLRPSPVQGSTCTLCGKHYTLFPPHALRNREKCTCPEGPLRGTEGRIAAAHGRCRLLKLLHRNNEIPYTEDELFAAVTEGHLRVVAQVWEQRGGTAMRTWCHTYWPQVQAALNGHLDILKALDRCEPGLRRVKTYKLVHNPLFSGRLLRGTLDVAAEAALRGWTWRPSHRYQTWSLRLVAHYSPGEANRRYGAILRYLYQTGHCSLLLSDVRRTVKARNVAALRLVLELEPNLLCAAAVPALLKIAISNDDVEIVRMLHPYLREPLRLQFCRVLNRRMRETLQGLGHEIQDPTDNMRKYGVPWPPRQTVK